MCANPVSPDHQSTTSRADTPVATGTASPWHDDRPLSGRRGEDRPPRASFDVPTLLLRHKRLRKSTQRNSALLEALLAPLSACHVAARTTNASFIWCELSKSHSSRVRWGGGGISQETTTMQWFFPPLGLATLYARSVAVVFPSCCPPLADGARKGRRGNCLTSGHRLVPNITKRTVHTLLASNPQLVLSNFVEVAPRLHLPLILCLRADQL